MPLFDFFTKHRRITIVVCAIILTVTVFVSATPNIRISKFLLAYFRDWSVVFSAVAAVVLLYVVYMSILKARELREEDRELDSKRRQLDDILNWEEHVRRELYLPRSSEIGDYERMLALESALIRNDWVVMIAQTFGKDFQNTVRQATKYLRAYVGAWPEKTPSNRYNALITSLNNVLESVYRIKTTQRL